MFTLIRSIPASVYQNSTATIPYKLFWIRYQIIDNKLNVAINTFADTRRRKKPRKKIRFDQNERVN